MEDMEATKVSTNRWMDKEAVVYTYMHMVGQKVCSGFSVRSYTMEYYSAIKKEWNFVICSNMDGLGGYYAMWNK